MHKPYRVLTGGLSVVMLLVVNHASQESPANNIRPLTSPPPTNAALSAPAFDLTGVWTFPGGTMHVYQNASDVTGILMNRYFAHLFRGQFEDPTTVVGMYASRRNRKTGCATNMKVTITILSKDRFRLRWLALDSKCDLKEGQQGADVEYRRQL